MTVPHPPARPPSPATLSDLPAPDWTWETRLSFDGVSYPATYLPGAEPWPQIAFVRGLPRRFEEDLLLAAQEADTAPAWQVSARPGEPMAARLERARARLRRDLDAYRTEFVTVLGVGVDGALELMGCGGARRRIAGQHDSEHWQVFARLLARPALRGRGLARHLAAAFIQAARAIGGGSPLGFFNETQSLPVVMLLELGRKQGVLDTVSAFGSRRSADAPDRTYLALYRGARAYLLEGGARARARAALSPELTEAVALCEAAWVSGLDHPRCQRLGALAVAAEPEARALAARHPFFIVYADFLAALRAWGLFEGVPVE